MCENGYYLAVILCLQYVYALFFYYYFGLACPKFGHA